MADETIRTEKDYVDDDGRVVDKTYDRDVHHEGDCSSSDAGPGAAMGGLGGAAVGAVAGAATGPGGALLGAVIGGVAGAVASGAAVGAVDRVDDDDAIKGETCDTVVGTTDTARTYDNTTYDTTTGTYGSTAGTPLRKTWETNPSMVGAAAGQSLGGSFMDYDNDFRNDWNTNYYNTGATYDEYQPAYQYGYGLYSDQRYANRDWANFENDARTDWEVHHPGTWDRFKNSIRYGWEKAKGAVTGENRYAA